MNYFNLTVMIVDLIRKLPLGMTILPEGWRMRT